MKDGQAGRTGNDCADAELHIPLGMLNDLVAATSTRDILDCMSKWSSEILDARHCVVALAHDPHSLHVTSFSGPTISDRDTVFPIEGTFLGKPMRNLQTNVLSNIAQSSHPLRDRFVAGGVETLIVTPIITQGRCFGVFGIGLGPAFGRMDGVTVFLETLAHCIANQLLIIDQIAQLDRLTRIDPLTESYNRRHFAKAASEMWERWERAGTRLAIISLDLDHFKKINDSFGHDAGDTVLQVVAQRIRGSIRPDDCLIRMGGEEFCVLIGNATRAMVRRVGHRIWHTIRENPIKTAQQTIPVSASVGLALVEQADTSYHTVLGRADAGLYQAKDLGRDQVCENALQSA